MNKVLIVIGGIVSAVATLAAKAGYFVCINFHRNEEKVNQLCEELRYYQTRIIAIEADISVESCLVWAKINWGD